MTTYKPVIATNIVLLACFPVLMCVVAFAQGPDYYLGIMHEQTQAARDVTRLMELDRTLFPLVVLVDLVVVVRSRSIRLAVGCCALLMTAQQFTLIAHRIAYGIANGDFLF